jgi:pyruvate, water dikinase
VFVKAVLQLITIYSRRTIEMQTISTQNSLKTYTLPFNQIGLENINQVGGKGSSLGEMYNNLSSLHVNVPNGFCVTTDAYREFIAAISTQIESKLELIMRSNSQSERSEMVDEIQYIICNQEFSEPIKAAITEAYEELCKKSENSKLSVAVRSSSISEDSEEASFAGQHSSYLHIRGIAKVLQSVKECFASMFNLRAINYRMNLNLNPLNDALPVVVQKMVYSDDSCAGVMLTIDPNSYNPDFIRIDVAFGLNEAVVSGITNPDVFYAYKPNVAKNLISIVSRVRGDKQITMSHNSRTAEIETHKTSRYNRKAYAMSLADANLLANWGVKIENYYSKLHGKLTPMDIEFAKDGPTGVMYVVQARPVTVTGSGEKSVPSITIYKLQEQNPVELLRGTVGSPGIISGKIRVLKSYEEMDQLIEGEILVTEATSPNWNPVLEKCGGVLTEQGGATCHASIISRELHKPSIVGIAGVLETLKTGDIVTLDCTKSAYGAVLQGDCKFDTKQINLDNLPKIKTKVYLNVAQPGEAKILSQFPVKGVGLLRSEFIIKDVGRDKSKSNDVGIHPMALVRYDELDRELRDKISVKTATYNKKTDFFIDEFQMGIAEITAAFAPRPVIVRLADLKSNEYNALLGGDKFEKNEENPMLGWRGASRYIDPEYRDAFDLECIALRRVRETQDLQNLVIMVPFCRSLEEGRAVIQALKENGLERGVNGLKVYVMAELPVNCLMSEEFCDVFDGFSIGSNDLTQLTLGIDRDGGKLANTFDETNPGVLAMMQCLFDGVRRFEKRTGESRYIGICGQGASNKPELVKWLIERGINSISLTEDAVFETILNIAEAEGQDVTDLRKQLEW